MGQTNDDRILLASTSLMTFLVNKSALVKTNTFYPYCNLTGSQPEQDLFAQNWKERPDSSYRVTLQTSNGIRLYVFSETETTVKVVSLRDVNLVDKLNEDSDLYELYDVKVYFSRTDGWFSWYDAKHNVVVTRKCQNESSVFKW